MLRILIIVIFLTYTGVIWTQPLSWYKKDYKFNYQFGIGLTPIVEDINAKNLLQVSTNWHFTPFPSSLFAQFYINKNFSWTNTFSYYNYQRNKLVERTLGHKNSILSLSSQLKLHGRIVIPSDLIDPYLVVGLGYTDRLKFAEIPNLFYTNFGLGIDCWITDKWACGLKTTLQLGLDNRIPKSIGNFQEFSLLLSYRIKNSTAFKSSSKAQHKWVKNRQNYRFRRSNR